MKHLGVVFAVAILSACGGDGESELVGIWEVTAWSQNPTACDTPGTSMEGPRGSPYYAVLDQTFFGQRFVSAVSCNDLEECRALFDDPDTLHIGNYTFESGSDDDGWTGTSTYAFVGSEQGTCTGVVTEHTMKAEGEELVIDSVQTEVTDYPQEADGSCDLDEAQELAADAPCNSREQLVAARVE